MGLIVAIANGSLAADITGNGLAQQVATAGNTEAFGLALFHGFSFPFEVTSLLLVVSVLGAVILGRRIRWPRARVEEAARCPSRRI